MVSVLTPARPIPSLRTLAFLALIVTAPAAAQTATWSVEGPQGGNVYCLVADPFHSSVLYAGTSLGVYKSGDGGATWAPSGNGMPTARVQTIVLDPTVTSTLYAGTVTPNGVPSLGIFKSVDSGQTWAPSNAGLIDPTSLSAPVDVGALAIDPHNSQTLVAGTRFSEIFKSTDGGATWAAKTAGGFDLALEVSSIVFDPTNSANVWAASTQGLIHSTDSGENWFFFGDAGIPFYTLAIDPTNPSTMYAGDNTGFGILKSTNGGNNWVQTNNSLPVNSNPAGGTSYPIINSLSFDPTHSTLYATTYSNGIFASNNAASSWAPLNTGLRTIYISALAFPEGDASTLLAASLGGGFYRSTDGAKTWATSNSGLILSLVLDLVLDLSDPQTLYAATFDGVQKSADGGLSWQSNTSGLPIFPIAALTLVPGSTETVLAGTLGGGLVQSVDGGATWTASAQGLNDSYINSLARDPNHASTLYAGTAHPDATSERVYTSTDGGKTWTQTSLDAGGDTVDFIAVNPANSAQVIAGSSGVASYFQSLDTGKTWTAVTPSTSCGAVNAFLFSASGSTLYLGGTSGVCSTTDNGTTWSPSAVGSYSVASLAADPTDPHVLYAGATLDAATFTSAVYRSLDAGKTWSLLGSGFPPATVTSLSVSLSGTVRAGTRGGGVAVLGLTEDRQAVAPVPPKGKPHTVGPH
jgi:hypothetical protein